MIRALTPEELSDTLGIAAETGFGSIDTERGCLPLRSLDVDVRIEGLTANTIVRQQFVNVFDEPLEATYIFPLPPRAAVIGFRMMVAGETIEGRIDERRKARRDYDTAVAAGQRAAIAEQERPDVFTLRVGNIPPRSAARIEFMLVAPLAVDSLEATYRFPLVVAPRYCPGVALGDDLVGDGIAVDTDLVPDASRISPPIMLPRLKSPVRLAITAHIAPTALGAGAAVDPVGCSLPAEEEIDEFDNRTVTVVPEQRLDRDFILRWKIAADAITVPDVLVEPDAARQAGLGTGLAAADAEGDGTFAVTILPPANAPTAEHPRDVVFVVDRSGSMGGWKMAAARRAVGRMIDALKPQDRVAVLAFDNSVEHAGDVPQLTPATDRERWRLIEWLASVEPRGGTELAAALVKAIDVGESDALRHAATDSSPRERFVVLVTDGQVGDEDRVLRRVATASSGTRLFVVGIDTAVNEGLLGRMADASGGLVELVESEGRLDEVMDRIQARLAPPLVTDLSIEGAGIEVVAGSIVPSRMPDLVAGVPLVLRGRYRGDASVGMIRIRGRLATGGEWEATAGVAALAVPGLGSLWARGMLRQLEDLYETSRGRDADLDARIVALSTSFGVLCRFTALVAIDLRSPDEPLRHAPTRRIVQPVESDPYVLYSLPREAPWLQKNGLVADDMSDSYSFDDFGDTTLGFVLDMGPALAEATRLLARAKPRSGRIGDVKPSRVKTLLRGVLRLLADLGRRGATPEVIEPLVAAYARLYALPHDRKALVTLLDALADLAGQAGQQSPAGRWWAAADVDAGAVF